MRAPESVGIRRSRPSKKLTLCLQQMSSSRLVEKRKKDEPEPEVSDASVYIASCYVLKKLTLPVSIGFIHSTG